MRKLTSFPLFVIVVSSVAAILQPTGAICNNPRLFTSGDSYVYTPGCGYNGCGTTSTSMTDGAVGFFWALGSGDPEIGSGNDNGTFSFLGLGGWAGRVPGYPTYFNHSWAYPGGIDGCVDPAPDKCMAILIMDNDADTGAGAFALLTDEPDLISNYNFDQGGPINLTAIPKPTITSAVDIVNNRVIGVSVSGVSLSDIAAGLYLDMNCAQPSGGSIPSLILGYQVFKQEIAITEPPTLSLDNDVDNWTPAGPVIPLGEPSQFSLTCGGDPAVAKYLTTGLVFDSGFRTVLLSGLSTRIECGANLAEPEDDVQRKPRNRERPRSRSRGR